MHEGQRFVSVWLSPTGRGRAMGQLWMQGRERRRQKRKWSEVRRREGESGGEDQKEKQVKNREGKKEGKGGGGRQVKEKEQEGRKQTTDKTQTCHEKTESRVK